jgi:hypothetical protein
MIDDVSRRRRSRRLGAGTIASRREGSTPRGTALATKSGSSSGVRTLERHGIHPRNLLAYMLVGYDRRETWERVFYRFNKMTALEIRPYPMIYGDRERTLPLGVAQCEDRATDAG